MKRPRKNEPKAASSTSKPVPDPERKTSESGSEEVPRLPQEASADETPDYTAERRVIAAILFGVFCVLLFQTLVGRWSGRELDLQRLPEHRFDYRLDANSANAMELRHLPGIGPKLAERIVREREANGPFGSVDDLRRVPGIGPKLSKRAAPYLRWPTEDRTAPASEDEP